MELLCPNCQQKLTIPDQYAGQLMRCPLCNGTFTAPALAPVPPPAPLPPTPPEPPSQPPTPPPVMSPPAGDVYSMSPAPTPPPPPVWQPEPTQPPPQEPPPAPLPPGDYTRTYSLALSERIVPWLTPLGLGLVFVLSFMPWVSVPELLSLNGWTLGFGHRANAIVGIYLLISMLAFVLSVPSFLFAVNLAPAPPFVKALGAWRPAIVGAIAFLAFVFMIYTYIDTIFTSWNTPGTMWMKLAVRCHVLAIVGSMLEFWLDIRRAKNLPPPRLEIRW